MEDYFSVSDPAAAIKRDFDVDDNGIIQDPGKFEGEMYYIVYYYDCGANGFADDSGGDVDTGGAWDYFKLGDEDYKKFPELEGVKTITLWHDSQGFVSIDQDSELPQYDDEEEPEESKKPKAQRIANLAENLLKKKK